MLVLSRKKEEDIRIGEHIIVRVVEIRGDQVRIGVEAPKTVEVHRQEIYELVQAEKARDPLPGSPHANRIAEAKRAWAACRAENIQYHRRKSDAHAQPSPR